MDGYNWKISRLNLNFRQANLGSSLSSIIIILCECDLTINQTFPNVVSLKLFRIFKSDYSACLELFEDELFKHNVLSIDWKCLPSITKLETIGWNFSNKGIDCMFSKQKLKTLVLENCTNISKDGKIIGFQNLSSLEIGAGSLNEIRSLEMLNNLKKIVLDCDGSLLHRIVSLDYQWCGGFEIHQNFVVENLPLLEELELTQFDTQLENNNFEKRIWDMKGIEGGRCNDLLLKNLPSLRKIGLYSTSTCCKIINCPLVHQIESEYSELVDFRFPSDVLCLKNVTIRGTNFSGISGKKPNLVDNLDFMKSIEVFDFLDHDFWYDFRDMATMEELYDFHIVHQENRKILRLISFENLRKLNISSMCCYERCSFRSVVDCPLLKQLSLVVDRDFEVENLPKVEEMNLVYRYPSGNVRICDFPSLKSLRLIFIGNEEGNNAIDIFNLNLSKLENLSVGVYFGSFRMAISPQFPALETLKIEIIENYTIDSIINLRSLKIGFAGTLNLLNLTSLEKIKFYKVGGVLKLHNLPKIRSVKVVNLFSEYTDMFIKELECLDGIKMVNIENFDDADINETKSLLNTESLVIKNFGKCNLWSTVSEVKNIQATFSKSFQVGKLRYLKELKCRMNDELTNDILKFHMPREIVVNDCQSLEKVEIVVDYNDERYPVNIVLIDLPQCHSLEFLGISCLQKLRVSRCPIKTLTLDISSPVKKEIEEDRLFRITSDLFPVLELLIIYAGEVSDRRLGFPQIKCISNIKSLKELRIRKKHYYNRSGWEDLNINYCRPFVKKLIGIDLDEVKVKFDNYTITMREYIDQMKE